LGPSHQREGNAFATDKAKAFHDVQIRNLYRILRRPEVVFDIVTKHHATFMWGDVQKALHRYIDEAPLFERVDARLKSSTELLLLRAEGVRDSSGASIDDKAIYTTRSMLEAERSLVKNAEDLSKSQTHKVSAEHIEGAINKANSDLEKHGGLSQDQVNAIHHIVGEGQIKCVVGIAGAGKTTALGICHDIWKAEGYAVYGLAPTGKAAQNLESKTLESKALESKTLEQANINSTTLHKFLKSFDEGRCQYNEKSVLVLDEAGMVDVERFQKLLGTVKQLGVKLIVVGDGAQLQPVEAGPAFRLMTARLGKAELNTVLRQNADWQKEATVLFGQQRTIDAITKYAEKGCVHTVEEKLPTLKEVLTNNDHKNLVKLYEVSHRVSSLMYREMVNEVKQQHPQLTNLYPMVKEHQDYDRYVEWKRIEKNAAENILQKSDACRPILEARCVDPFKMGMLFVDKKQSLALQQEEAKSILKDGNLDHLIGIEKPKGLSVDVRQTAKAEMVQAWHAAFKEGPEKNSLMLTYSNRDVNDLNTSARSLLKESGHIAQKEFTYGIRREIEDDFGRKHPIKEEKGFSKGDRIVFTRNNYGLGVKNGTMGTITNLDPQKVQVKLDEGKEVSFTPNLNPHFDQGWAITIHKSQGTTVDNTYVLASYEMNQNLSYVGMTRHRDNLHVFGSSLDFWREEKLPEVLSKSGEKLSAADYLDTDSLEKLMQREDKILAKIFTRVSDELEAMGAVSKKIFWNVANHFLGTHKEREIRVSPDGIREEVRAEDLLQQKTLERTTQPDTTHSLQKNTVAHEHVTPALQAVYEDWKHPAFQKADHYKKVFQEGLKLYGETGAIQYWQSKREPFLKMYEQKLETVEHELKSPLLSYFSDEARDLARKSALDDPDKTLSFLSQVQAAKHAELEEKDRMARAAQFSLRVKDISLRSSYKESLTVEDETRKQKFHEAFSAYHKFKDLKREYEDTYDRDLKKEMWKVGKIAFEHKEAFGQIQKIDPDTSKEIQKMAQMKERELSLGRGGLSL